MTPNLEEFKELAKKGNLVPVYKELLSDMETPVSVLSRFVEDEHAFLLESVEGGRVWGRYSIIGVDPKAIFSVTDGIAKLETKEGEIPVENPQAGFQALRDVMGNVKPVEVKDLPRFTGGAVGYMGYEIVNEFEPHLPKPKEDTTGVVSGPTTCYMLCDNLIVFDNVRHTMKIVANARLDEESSVEEAYEHALARIESMHSRLKEPVHPETSRSLLDNGETLEFEENISHDDYCDIVKKAKDYIVQGEIIQVVLSQRFTTKAPATPMALYRALRLVNPSPYTFLCKFGDQILIGASPEVMVRLTDGEAVVRPIAGTRHRGKTEQQDRELADELLADPKEKAEHLMLVDLGRNDLGRVAVPGSVKVPEFMIIEKYSHVQHMVSTVTAQLKPEMDIFSLIAAVFPAGTLSGAPKFRAMQIINELEPGPRGVYGGAMGYIGYDGNADLAITIRTMVLNGDKVSIQAGAGVVYDSVPQKEYEECHHKANAMMRALELAHKNLNDDLNNGGH